MAELNLRTSAVNAIRRIYKRVAALQPETAGDAIQLEQELQSVKAHFDRFIVNHEAMVRSAKETELESHEQLWAEMEDFYNMSCVALKRRLLGHTTSGQTPPDRNAFTEMQLKLEPLTIPTFDGALHNWLAFKDAFETLVHNIDFPEAYKLGKLRQAVKASAVPLIGGLYSGGYAEVWSALKERYDNRKQLAEIHVSRFLSIKATPDDTPKSLLAIVDAVNESLRALRVMQLPVDQWDALAVPIVVSKLPTAAQRDWCMSSDPVKIPTLDELLKFVQQRAHSLTTEIGTISGRAEPRRSARGEAQLATRAYKANMATVQASNCAHCNGLHRIVRCSRLLGMPVDQRFSVVRDLRLCFNCLKSGHSSRQCPSSACRNCNRRHNTILCQSAELNGGGSCPPELTARGGPLPSFSSASPNVEEPVTSCLVQANQTVLLATARAQASGRAGRQCLVRILCDPGSQVSFISERIANTLALFRRRHNITVEGIGATHHTETRGSASLTLQSMHSDFKLDVDAYVLPSITSVTPSVPVDTDQWRHLRGLELADPMYGSPGGIDVLLGADLWGGIIDRGIISGASDEPHAQRTRLGWVIFGPAATLPSTAQSSLGWCGMTVCTQDADTRLEELVSSFWKLEDLPLSDGVSDDECARIFQATHSRTSDGRYVVTIPLQREAPSLGESFTRALRQFNSLERRLAADAEVREKYIAFMNEFHQLGHMESVERPIDHTKAYYIPHHAVTSKFRVVFNASARTTNGISLNDIQLVGPTIQEPLLNIIFRFRRFRVAITADIEKMFRQILVAPEHRDFQRILWRDDPREPLGVYRLKTVTYGMASSPYNATRALHQCALDNMDMVADATEAITARDAILTSFYVDDFLASCDDEASAVRLATNVDAILAAGHFKLRKWNSNNIEALQRITEETSNEGVSIDSRTTSVLGLKWDPVADELFFVVTRERDRDIPTKRRVLSEVAQLFDPTGLVAPVIIAAKIFLQSLWSSGSTWDEALPVVLQHRWQEFRNGLVALNQVRVPRWIGVSVGQRSELHGFCDASSHAYASVIYLKTTNLHGGSQVALLTARTKVAPLKGATIPRFELCAAHLLAKTLTAVQMALRLTDTPYHLWSDSTIVLCWLHKQPTTLKPYASNRVRQIQEWTSIDCWRHVRSAENPADCAKLWWQGPDWLSNESISAAVAGPDRPEDQLTEEELEALRLEQRVISFVSRASPVSSLTTRRRDGQVIPLLERFSSLNRLLRTIALMLRWCPTRHKLRTQVICPDELEDALNILIRIEQGNCFKPEINALLNRSRLPTSSPLLRLNPYLDESGRLRVGGRIEKAALAQDQMFPVILPRHSCLVTLLIRQIHDTTLHGGTQLMLQTLRRRFWVINGRQAVRSYLHHCTVCRRFRGATINQQMAALPAPRVNSARPFISTGLDYCGPFTLRIGAKRSRVTTKTYLAIFVCMATKAVHIELVDDLSAYSFLDAYSRFTSRRGLCRDLYSDNGTSFVGANRHLQEDFKAWHSEHNQQSMAENGTRWHFITPRAPHQGGLWEAAVKSAKHHLRRVIGSQVLWHTQLQTLATRIEACLNSRPLVPLSDDPEDKFALTPGDFLIGAPLLAVPEPNLTDVPTNRLKQWQYIRALQQMFWQRWSEEYLTTLQIRNKWQRRLPNIQIGDVVLVKEELPPTHWRMGRVVDVHPGSDGMVRNATLKTAYGNCTRPVQKLCHLLETDDFEPPVSTGQDV